ncbi:MAG: tripartite tricarboxylate transporter substrate-binding protein [Betaproteobacteria bacterium]|nr:tripartite tricarboxylate transporter substrate binding protein BugD [Betaproteobacteria bacterium]
MLRIITTIAAAFAALSAGIAQAQDYPTRPISIVVPFAAGGPTDTLGRNLAAHMTKTLKQQVIVENRAGAGGTLGVGVVAKAKPDGYQILLHHIGMSTAPTLYRKLPFNPLTDFEYIGQVADVPMTLIARTGLPPDNYKDFIAYIKANRDKLNLGNAGLGAASHLCGLLFMSRIQADIQTVPYNGTGPAMTALMGNQIDLMCDQTTNTTGPIQSGRVKVFGVTTRKRIPALPFVPTLQEQGLKDFEIAVWHGLYAPKGTPKAVLDKLNAALNAALKDQQFRDSLTKLGAEAVTPDRATPESLAKHLKAEIDKWAPIIKQAGQFAD